MNYFFWDASALAKRYNREEGTDLVNRLWDQVAPDRMLCLGLAYGECVSIFVRSRNGGRITETDFQQAMANLRHDVIDSTMQMLPSPNELMLRSARLIDQHSINATDALVLRAALDRAALLRTEGNDLVLVTSDKRLLGAAREEGLQTFNPQEWEAFVAKPTLARLLDVLDAAAEAERAMMMQQAAQYIKDYLAHPPHREAGVQWDDAVESPAWIDRSVLAHAYLLAEEWEAVHQLAADRKALAWSSGDNPQGLVVPFFLMLLSGKSLGALSPNLKQLWQQGLQKSIGFGWGKEAESVLNRLQRAYLECVRNASLSHEQQDTILAWCLNVSTQRVSGIVSDQRRGSYGKAAMLIVACAETLRLRGKDKEAHRLLEDVRSQFPRHRAFQAELKAAVQRG